MACLEVATVDKKVIKECSNIIAPLQQTNKEVHNNEKSADNNKMVTIVQDNTHTQKLPL